MSDADITRILENALGKPIAITTRRRVGGGCIHHAERITTTIGDIFIKHNAAHHGEKFQAEADGLQTLANTKTLRTPKCLAVSTSDHEACLILEWIDSKPKRADFWEHFGEALAHLHQHTNSHFGYKRDNFIGNEIKPTQTGAIFSEKSGSSQCFSLLWKSACFCLMKCGE
jgi:fructosamine-3-kinase